MNTRVKELVLIGIFSALTFIGTSINFAFISTTGGLVHFGSPVIVIAALLFGKRVGALSGAIGMTIFDIVGGWALYAPITLVARFLMGYLIGSLGYKNNSLFQVVIAVLIGSLVMVVIYYFGQAIIYQSFITPITSIPGDLIQVLTCFVFGLPIALILRDKV